MSRRSVAGPPVAKTTPHVAVVHGDVRDDDYFWLRDRDDPAVEAYLRDENAYAERSMASQSVLVETLYDEMLSHIKQTDLGVPYRLGAYLYYSRTEEGRQYPILARRRAPDSPEEITLDLNELARDHAFLGLGAYEISPDGHLLAYALDTTGYRQYVLHVLDLRSGVDLPDTDDRVGSVVWANDSRTLVYTTEDSVSKRRDRVWRRALGDERATQIYFEADERFDVGATIANDRSYVFVASYSKDTTEWRMLPADAPSGPLAPILPRVAGHRYSVEHHGEFLYMLTNRDAPNFRLVRAPVAAPGEATWEPVVDERPDVFLDRLDAFAGHLVLDMRAGGYGGIEVYDLASATLWRVPADEAAHAMTGGMNPEFAARSYRYAYSSFVTPQSVYDVDLVTRERTLLKRTEVPRFDPAAYQTHIEYATAGDGTRIPISLVTPAGAARDGSHPLLLYGYGSYGISIDPTFSATRLVLLDRGVSYAIAHVRGGGELGEHWRTAGHLDRKLTTFDDFIACAEHLVAAGFTAPERLAIEGGSAGGLLVSTVANMRPDLFAAVVSHVPFVDVVNTMLDASLPLTTAEYLEWGNPTVAADYAYMMRYSPYDNVRAQAYPAMLVKVSINDSQVPYWEGAKLVAKLRVMKTDNRPLYLVTNMGAGHGGASGRYDHLREIAHDDAFILSVILAGSLEVAR